MKCDINQNYELNTISFAELKLELLPKTRDRIETAEKRPPAEFHMQPATEFDIDTLMNTQWRPLLVESKYCGGSGASVAIIR